MKGVKKIASVALPIVGALTGNPLLAAAGSAVGTKLGGGSLGQSLLSGALGGLTGGIGNSITGAPMLNTGIGFLDDAASGINSFLSPVGTGIKNVFSGATSGLSNLFGDTGGAMAPEQISGALAGADPSLLSAGSSIPQGSALSSGSEAFLNSLNGSAPSGAAASSSGSMLSNLVSKISNNPLSALTAGVTLSQALDGNKVNGEQTQSDVLAQQQARDQQAQQFSQQTVDMLNNASLGRSPTLNPVSDYYTYGQRPEANFFTSTNKLKFAKGGYVHGGALSGGQADDVDAKLSHGEYVVPADVVSGLGDGTSAVGAKKLDKMAKKVRIHKTGRSKFPPKAKPMNKYMGALSAA